MKIEILNEKEIKAAMKKLGDDLPKALADGLNRTMRGIEQAELNGMERSIDRPIPFTMNALKTWKAHPRHLDAGMFVQPLQADYLRYAIEGGRVESTLEPVIGRAKLTDAGNIPSKKTRGLFGAKGRKSSKSRGFFVGTPGNAERILPYGLWERIGQEDVKLIAKRVKNVPREKRFPYYTIAEQIADKRLRKDALDAVDDWLRRGLA